MHFTREYHAGKVKQLSTSTEAWQSGAVCLEAHSSCAEESHLQAETWICLLS